MKNILDTKSTVNEIVTTLNKYEVPIMLIPCVFDRVMKDINAKTIPYNPADRKDALKNV